MLLKMAIRNVGRHKRRSLLALISMIIAMMLILFMQGMLRGLLDSLVENVTRFNTGHIRIVTNEFAERERFLPVDSNIPHADSLLQALVNDPVLQQAGARVLPRIRFGVLLENEGLNHMALAMAGEPAQEDALLQISPTLLPGGHYLENERDLIMGDEMANILDYQPGDTVKVVTVGSDDALHLRKFHLRGQFHTGVSAFDRHLFMIGLEDAQHLLRLQDGMQQIVIMLAEADRVDNITRHLQENYGNEDLRVISWKESSAEYGYIRYATNAYGVMFLLIALMGSFIIGNIMTMVVMERRREIGILKALGFTSGQVQRLFLLEGMILGFTGSLLGLILGYGLIQLINIHGLDFSGSLQSMESFAINPVLILRLQPVDPLKFLGLGTLIAMLVSIAPSRRAARLQAAETIHEF